jgi:hypothetical protein
VEYRISGVMADNAVASPIANHVQDVEGAWRDAAEGHTVIDLG